MVQHSTVYTTNPKKSQLKQQQKASDFSRPPSMEAPSSPPPPQPPKDSFARRYKFFWPLLLTVNLALGAYLFVREKKKDTGVKDGEAAADVPSTPIASSTTPVPEKPLHSPAITEPVKVRQPIPEDQQRELYKWILEEKRKGKPKDSEEKKQFDEEKAILKQFIRAKAIPSI
ncbi:hypothetical protein HHK36_021774 [Tetracentron sinense]|uniref:Uncharacterized protein n=1 Tax=Tetracentron sinense TaxID=13715 RepID=A0A834YST4_TETSI|nr:hypothetical protein HHK36_021774 [Tetracentron sinense]